ncbi:hypothetical protein D7X55_22540 [Corallococcus sp. AB049A]|uniref:alpha-ketoglutarate-dependent dioxygenase AlkB n=1 Tax=Corallococcus sp. AB049A TaxID=2316721 RepID=UPI000ED06873|nr:hypothetical protein D7X55_22540 [Corallococcus sp. AB049A]
MHPTTHQGTLSFAGEEKLAKVPDASNGQSLVRLALTLNHREWINLLADEWWPSSNMTKPIRLGVGSPKNDATDGIAVVAWIDPAQLPQLEVLVWRENRWTKIPIAKITPSDHEVAWPGPIPLFSIVSFLVSSSSDAARLMGIARGFSNVAPPEQPIQVGQLNFTSIVSEDPISVELIQLPPIWSKLRGAVAMATWSVPAVAPWLSVFCSSLSFHPARKPASTLGAEWWNSPPWRMAAADSSADNCAILWRCMVDTLVAVDLRDSWRPTSVLSDIKDRALQHGINREPLETFTSDTLALLNDDQHMVLAQGPLGQLGLILQLVLLRATPERFITWTHDLKAIPPVVFWTGATLAGLIQGYKDLEQRFRGKHEGRRRLAVRTRQFLSPDSAREPWLNISDADPEWQHDSGKIHLTWDNSRWAERLETSRGRWLSADLDRPDAKKAAIDLACRFHPPAAQRYLTIRDESIPVSGTGSIRLLTTDSPTLIADGEIRLRIPQDTSVTTDLDIERFRSWLICDGIAERLPDPPLQRATASPHANSDDIPGLTISRNFISEKEELELIQAVDSAPWLTVLSRRVQHYGWTYNYKAKSVDFADRLGPLPPWAEQLGKRIVALGFADTLPDQVIVNEYVEKQGISKHIDCKECFRGPVVTISLCETWDMFFWSPDNKKHVQPLERRSIAVLTGPSRDSWKHEIPKRLNESWGRRGRRISLTFRKVNTK